MVINIRRSAHAERPAPVLAISLLKHYKMTVLMHRLTQTLLNQHMSQHRSWRRSGCRSLLGKCQVDSTIAIWGFCQGMWAGHYDFALWSQTR